jgi:hypothetical protein
VNLKIYVFFIKYLLNKMSKVKKKCVIFNYIPHKTPKILNSDRHFEKWYECYKEELFQMYYSTMNLVKEKYDSINVESDRNFNLFINLIYNSSSKYISKDR